MNTLGNHSADPPLFLSRQEIGGQEALRTAVIVFSHVALQEDAFQVLAVRTVAGGEVLLHGGGWHRFYDKSGESEMPRPQNAAERRARVEEILRRLDAAYPNVKCALEHKNAWQLLVATILSAQCTDKRVNIVTPELFRKYPTIQDMAAVRQVVLEKDIQSTGFYRNKSKSLIGAAKKILADYGGQVPQTIEEMLTIPGAARKTANVVLGSWYGKATGVVVDTHVQRIARRLDLTKEKDPVKIERDLMKILPQEKWIEFSHQIIHHGRQVCYARKPACGRCNLEPVCYSKEKVLG